ELNQGGPVLSSMLPTNARCRLNENFPTYQSPTPFPPRPFSSKDEKGTGFCGTFQVDTDDLEPPSGGAIIGWLLPWVFMLSLARVLIHLHRTLGGATL